VSNILIPTETKSEGWQHLILNLVRLKLSSAAGSVGMLLLSGSINMSSFTPAYGRDYENASDVFADWVAGKDFVLRDVTSRWDGKYCSEVEFHGGERHQLRYNKKEEVLVVWYEPKQGWFSDPMIVS